VEQAETLSQTKAGYALFMPKKLTKAEQELNTRMLSILEYASKHPDRWHTIGRDEDSKQAVELLVKRGVLEVRQPMNQYKLIKT
jgi:hypothetical protein